jgi:cell fate regulator YaaT (PSP1 superfamily)
MAQLAGISFRQHGKVYYFDQAGLTLKLGDRVVVETARGQELGDLVALTSSELAGEPVTPLKPVLRVATNDDLKRSVDLKAREQEALAECGRVVARLGLTMKLIAAEYSFDRGHLTIFFSAEGRIDFRELVRELSHTLRVRVELRQIGPRDEAKVLGGYGRCGRPLCCASFLGEFSPVSIKMAKTQDLPLNPMKISGVCGRLLCCLGYECEQYRVIKEKMPREGSHVITDAGPGIVVGSNTLEEKVIVEYESGARLEVPMNKIKVLEAQPQSGPQPIAPVLPSEPFVAKTPVLPEPSTRAPNLLTVPKVTTTPPEETAASPECAPEIQKPAG